MLPAEAINSCYLTCGKSSKSPASGVSLVSLISGNSCRKGLYITYMCNQGKLFTTFWFNCYAQQSYDLISHDGYFVEEEALHKSKELVFSLQVSFRGLMIIINIGPYNNYLCLLLCLQVHVLHSRPPHIKKINSIHTAEPVAREWCPL